MKQEDIDKLVPQLKDFNMVARRESWGGLNNIDIVVLVKINRPMTEKDSTKASAFIDEYNTYLMQRTVWDDPDFEKKKMDNVEELVSCFKHAGFELIHVREIPNQYDTLSPYTLEMPWVIVTTKYGPITMGWRRRVINIDWSSSQELLGQTENLMKAFKSEDVTKSPSNIHAHSKDKAIAYLRTIRLVMEEFGVKK